MMKDFVRTISILGGFICCTLVWLPASQAAEGANQEWAEVMPPTGTTWDDLPPIRPGPEDWPWWRGPHFDNCAAEPQNPPTRWSPTENVLWKAELPGLGHGSPSIWGNRIFLAAAHNEAEVQDLLCYDRATGKKLWQTEIHRGGFMHMHPKNSHASSTAACDGQRVFITFMVQDGIWLTALDLKGKILWQKKAAPFQSLHGYGASPLLYQSLVIVPADNPGPNYLTALRRDTGEVAWRIRRIDSASFASPLVAHIAGRDQLVIIGPLEIDSYDPNTGRRLWYCQGPTKQGGNNPVYDAERIYASAGFPEKKLYCIRADGTGDVTATHLVWQMKTRAAFIPSPLLHAGLLYLVNDSGLLFCIDAPTGDVLWTHKLEGGFSASLTLAGGNLYVPNEAGVTYVLKPGREFQLLASNDLGDGGFATPVICGSRIFLRTKHSLYCLGEAEK